MAFSRGFPSIWSILALSRTRSLLATLRYRILVGLIAIAYAVSAMLFAGMLYIPSQRLPIQSFFYVYPTGPGPAWTYPAILAGSPYFELDLPFTSAILMTLSAAGIGLGMSLGVLLVVRLIRQRRAGLLRPATVGSLAGFTPAMLGLVTLGACCSTTAAATAGIGLAAQSSGTNAATLLANTWYLGIFQVVVVYVALVAQEELVILYGREFDRATPPEPFAVGLEGGTVAPLGWRGIGGALLRIALLVAGVTWSLAMFVGWISIPPQHASAATWFGWVFQHQVPGVLAIMIGLSPSATLARWTKLPTVVWGLALRGILVVSGVALLTWMPVTVSGAGSPALGNELLGYWGFPAAWGAVPPPAFGLYGLLLRWMFQFGLLGGTALLMGVAPDVLLKPLLPARSPDASAGAPGAPSAHLAVGPPAGRGRTLAGVRTGVDGRATGPRGLDRLLIRVQPA